MLETLVVVGKSHAAQTILRPKWQQMLGVLAIGCIGLQAGSSSSRICISLAKFPTGFCRTIVGGSRIIYGGPCYPFYFFNFKCSDLMHFENKITRKGHK